MDNNEGKIYLPTRNEGKKVSFLPSFFKNYNAKS